MNIMRIMKYSSIAKMRKIVQMNIQRIRGQILSDFRMLVSMLLFMLIIVRKSVRRRPSLPGTTSRLIAKLIQLVITIIREGKK